MAIYGVCTFWSQPHRNSWAKCWDSIWRRRAFWPVCHIWLDFSPVLCLGKSVIQSEAEPWCRQHKSENRFVSSVSQFAFEFSHLSNLEPFSFSISIFSAYNSRTMSDWARLCWLSSVLVCGYYNGIARIQWCLDCDQFTELTRFGTQLRGHIVRSDQFLWYNHRLHYALGCWTFH